MFEIPPNLRTIGPEILSSDLGEAARAHPMAGGPRHAPGGVVLDPFAGSGTTGQAALAEGRHPILIEKEPEYVRIIRHRLADPVQLTFAVR